MSSSKLADSSSTAIAIAVALLALLLLVGGGVAFFLVRRARTVREIALVEEAHARRAEERLARMRAVEPAQPGPALEDDAELESALGQVLHERFTRRTGQPGRAPEELAEIAQTLSTAITSRARPPATEYELLRECGWAWEQAGRFAEAEQEHLRALELLGADPSAPRAEIEADLARLRSQARR